MRWHCQAITNTLAQSRCAPSPDNQVRFLDNIYMMPPPTHHAAVGICSVPREALHVSRPCYKTSSILPIFLVKCLPPTLRLATLRFLILPLNHSFAVTLSQTPIAFFLELQQRLETLRVAIKERTWQV